MTQEKNITQPTEVEELKNAVAELTKIVMALKSEKEVVNKHIKKDIPEDVDSIRINPDEYIKIMSLCPYTLNLSTEAKGRGKTFSFQQFGQVKRILYSDLVLIIENHSNFLNDGYFVILNSSVVRRHGLDEIYEHILTKENIDKILVGNQSDAVSLFKNANANQQKLIVDLFIQKILNGEQIDYNFLDRLSRIIGFNIAEKAESIRKQQEILNTSK